MSPEYRVNQIVGLIGITGVAEHAAAIIEGLDMDNEGNFVVRVSCADMTGRVSAKILITPKAKSTALLSVSADNMELSHGRQKAKGRKAVR